jgi:mono/diheme cytochrome c family protein
MNTRVLLIGGVFAIAVAAGTPRDARVQAVTPVQLKSDTTPGETAVRPKADTTSRAASVQLKPDTRSGVASDQGLVDKYCVTCHNDRTKSGNLTLAGLDAGRPGDHPETFEKVVRKVRAGLMPPAGLPRPDRVTLDAFATSLEAGLDRAVASHPNPGRRGLHRMNRTEYANAIRDLLDLEIDETTLLPADDSSEGFDNIADALRVSPALIERYTSAAVKVSRLAVGNMLLTASTVTYRVPGDLVQSGHLEGLPLGTRGGTLIEHTFPLDAEYAFKIRVRGAAIGLAAANLAGEEVEVSVNGERIKLVPAMATIDVKLPMKAGPHALGITFVRKPPAGADDIWGVYATNSGVQSVAITGPLTPSGLGESPSRRRIFACRPSSTSDEVPCARRILGTIARRAFRQPVTEDDVSTLVGFYETGRQNGTFDAGIEQGLARILVDPRFVFRVEREQAGIAPGQPYRISNLELASRLSFFLWSSIPDEELLDVATTGTLRNPDVLAHQTRRMLADPKADALVSNFGGQWLYLRELKNVRPEAPGFSENLRRSLRRETEMLLDSIVREDRSVVDLLNADYTFVDEMLARHYGIPGVRGSRFRRVPVTDEARRGLLGHGSFLLVTSVANRTSPVSRGKWVLENLMGVPPPLPPPNVPSIDESPEAAKASSLRQKMEAHRKNPVCASCHQIMDPIGFSLENFDLIGRWRTTDGGATIDATSQLVDGTRLDGPGSLRKALLNRSDVFVRTMTEKLLTYGTGRALRYYDMPVVRQVVREAGRDNYRFSALVLGIVRSDPFQMKTGESGQ